jgi:hypothetical protein
MNKIINSDALKSVASQAAKYGIVDKATLNTLEERGNYNYYIK